MMHSIVGPECVLSKADLQESLYAIKDIRCDLVMSPRVVSWLGVK